jgi:hypothetical protein
MCLGGSYNNHFIGSCLSYGPGTQGIRNMQQEKPMSFLKCRVLLSKMYQRLLAFCATVAVPKDTTKWVFCRTIACGVTVSPLIPQT